MTYTRNPKMIEGPSVSTETLICYRGCGTVKLFRIHKGRLPMNSQNSKPFGPANVGFFI